MHHSFPEITVKSVLAGLEEGWFPYAHSIPTWLATKSIFAQAILKLSENIHWFEYRRKMAACNP